MQVLRKIIKRLFTFNKGSSPSLPSTIKYLIFCDNKGPTYQISFQLPFYNLGYKENIDFATITEMELQKICSTNHFRKFVKEILTLSPKAVVFSRFSSPSGKTLITNLKNKNIKIINHLDDYLLKIPPSLGLEIHNRLNKPEKIEVRKMLISAANLNYVSTNYLKSKLQTEFPKAKFYSGIYASFQSKFTPIPAKKTNKIFTIGYMGSKGHIRDFEKLTPQLLTLLESNPNTRFELFGSIKMPKELKSRFPERVCEHPVRKSYTEFLEYLSSLNWDVGLIPLILDDWNQCKAPTKFIEYTMCGIPVVSSPINVYSEIAKDKEEIILCNEDTWCEVLDNLSRNRDQLKKILKNATIMCKRSFSIDKLSEQVKQVLNA